MATADVPLRNVTGVAPPSRLAASAENTHGERVHCSTARTRTRRGTVLGGAFTVYFPALMAACLLVAVVETLSNTKP